MGSTVRSPPAVPADHASPAVPPGSLLRAPPASHAEVTRGGAWSRHPAARMAQRRRRLGEGPAVRRVVTLIIAACLLVACSTTESPTPGPGSIARRRSLRGLRGDPPPEVPLRRLAPPSRRGAPTVPATGSAARFRAAARSCRGDAGTRDPSSDAARIAAEFQQVAVSLLVVAPVAFRRRVTALLDRQAARVTRSNVRAATLLRSLGEPQERLPLWRIVPPPPATRAARLLPAGATTQWRAVDLPGGHPPGRDAHGPDPRHQYGRGARADAVPSVDLGPVRRRRRHQRSTRRDPRRRPSPQAPRRARQHGRRAVALQPF